MWKWIAVLPLALFSANVPCKGKQGQDFLHGTRLTEGQLPVHYNAEACVDLDGLTFHSWISYTYWNVNQENLDVAYVSPVASAIEADVVPGSVVAVEPTWSSGFQLGAAINLGYDGWVAAAEYTWVRSSNSVFAENTTGNTAYDYTASAMFPDYVETNSQVSSTFHVALDQCDAVFSRPLYESPKIVMSPYGGLRGLWIREKQSFDLGGILPSYLVHCKSQCWSVGPVGGMGGHWFLGRGFRFEGNLGASLLYARYTTVSFHESFPETDGYFTMPGNISGRGAIRPTSEFGVGMGWGSYLADRSYYIDFSARYDFRYYWAQNMMRVLTSTLAGYGVSNPGALMLQGLTLTGKFDF